MPPQIDPQQLMQMIMGILTQTPEEPTGNLAGGTTPMGPPSFAKTPDPMEAMLMMLMQMVQQPQAMSQQQSMNAVSGQQGAAFGGMGGRPLGGGMSGGF